MTSCLATLHDVHKYDGKQHIQIINDSTLSITSISNLGSSFSNIFVSPDLSAKLVLV